MKELEYETQIVEDLERELREEEEKKKEFLSDFLHQWFGPDNENLYNMYFKSDWSNPGEIKLGQKYRVEMMLEDLTALGYDTVDVTNIITAIGLHFVPN